jgi:hypothetical protein
MNLFGVCAAPQPDVLAEVTGKPDSFLQAYQETGRGIAFVLCHSC